MQKRSSRFQRINRKSTASGAFPTPLVHGRGGYGPNSGTNAAALDFDRRRRRILMFWLILDRWR
jgi:hypothetical protein